MAWKNGKKWVYSITYDEGGDDVWLAEPNEVVDFLISGAPANA